MHEIRKLQNRPDGGGLYENRLQRADGIGWTPSVLTMALNFAIEQPFCGQLAYS